MIFLSNFFTLLHRLMIFFHHFSHGTVSILFVFPFKFPRFPRFHEFRKIHRNSTFLSNPGKFPRFKKSPQKPTWKFPRLWQHCDLAADRGKPLELWKTVRCSPFKLVLVNFLRSQLFFCMWTSWALKVVEVKALSV